MSEYLDEIIRKAVEQEFQSRLDKISFITLYSRDDITMNHGIMLNIRQVRFHEYLSRNLDVILDVESFKEIGNG